MNVDLHIDRLVIEGLAVAPGEHRLIGAAVERELGRLLAAGGVSPALAAGGSVASLRAAPIRLATQDPASIGTQIARTVHGGLTSE